MTAGTYNSGSLREPNRVRAGRVTHRIQRKHDLVARRRRGSDDLGQRTDASAHTDGAARRAYLVVVTFVHVHGEALFCRVTRVEEATRTAGTPNRSHPAPRPVSKTASFPGGDAGMS